MVDGVAFIQPGDGEDLTAVEWENLGKWVNVIHSINICSVPTMCQALKLWIRYPGRIRRMSGMMPRLLALMTKDTDALINWHNIGGAGLGEAVLYAVFEDNKPGLDIPSST